MEFVIFKDDGMYDGEEEDYPHELTSHSYGRIHNHIHNLLVKSDSMNCKGCGKEFDTRNLEVWMYDHKSGWDIGLDQKQWLSILCDCGYHTSFNKLGMGRRKVNYHYFIRSMGRI
jgi:hypothetical protein